MPFKNLEHEGTEDYNDGEFPSRKNKNTVEESIAELENLSKDNNDKEELDDSEWLNENNPFLWEPLDIDDF